MISLRSAAILAILLISSAKDAVGRPVPFNNLVIRSDATADGSRDPPQARRSSFRLDAREENNFDILSRDDDPLDIRDYIEALLGSRSPRAEPVYVRARLGHEKPRAIRRGRLSKMNRRGGPADKLRSKFSTQKPAQPKPAQPKPAQPKPAQPKPGPSNAGPSNAGPSNAGPSNAGQQNLGLSNAGQPPTRSSSSSSSAPEHVKAAHRANTLAQLNGQPTGLNLNKSLPPTPAGSISSNGKKP